MFGPFSHPTTYSPRSAQRLAFSSPFSHPFFSTGEEDEDTEFFFKPRRNQTPTHSIPDMDSLFAEFLRNSYIHRERTFSTQPQETRKPIRIPIQIVDNSSPSKSQNSRKISTPEESEEETYESENEYEDSGNEDEVETRNFAPNENQNDITPEEWSKIEAMEQQEKKEKEKRRMLERLIAYGMKERLVDGDGNCQFASLSDQLFQTPSHHKKIRQMIVSWLLKNPDYCLAPGTYLRDFLQTDRFETWEKYCDYLIKEGSWGDHITLLAASEVFQRKIVILSSIEINNPKTDPITIITPKKVKHSPIYLCHWHERHYGSLIQTN